MGRTDELIKKARNAARNLGTSVYVGRFSESKMADGMVLFANEMESQQERIRELEAERDELKAEVARLSGKTMVLRNGKKVSEIEYYRLRFPKMVERIEEASRLLNEHSDY